MPKSRYSSSSRRVKKIENPDSGRWIRVGGPAYKDLLKMGYTAAELRGRKSSMKKKASRRYSRNAGVKTLGPRRRMRVSRSSRSSTRGKGRGSRTRGWGKVAPKRGKQRNRLMSDCGSKCFLDPSHKAFPVCAKVTGRKSRGSCELDCRGIEAAIIRAGQWGYKDIERNARKLYQMKCGRKYKK